MQMIKKMETRRILSAKVPIEICELVDDYTKRENISINKFIIQVIILFLVQKGEI